MHICDNQHIIPHVKLWRCGKEAGVQVRAGIAKTWAVRTDEGIGLLKLVIVDYCEYI